MNYCYVSLDQLRFGLNINLAQASQQAKPTDETLLRIGEMASEFIDFTTGRTFRVYHGTRYYSPEFSDKLVVHDLLSVTTLKTDWNYDDAYEQTWATTDYLLQPINAVIDERPFTVIRTRTGGTQGFPNAYEKSVEIVGKWGYWERLDTLTATVDGGFGSGVTTLRFTAISEIEPGNTLKIGNEQLYVKTRDSSVNEATVVRGVNGTSAAAISNGASVQVFRYPDSITTAAQMFANRIYRRLETPLGIVNVPGDIGWRAVYIPRFDVDIREMLSAYRRENWFA